MYKVHASAGYQVSCNSDSLSDRILEEWNCIAAAVWGRNRLRQQHNVKPDLVAHKGMSDDYRVRLKTG